MKLYGEYGKEFEVKNASRPKMTRGCWDFASKKIDKVQYRFFFEGSYGQYFYFVKDGKWYKIDVHDTYDNVNLYTSKEYQYSKDQFDKDETESMFFNTVYEIRQYYPMNSHKEYWDRIHESFMFNNDTLADYDFFMKCVNNPTKAQEKVMKMFDFKRWF